MSITLGATYDGTSLVTLVGSQYRIFLRCIRGLDDSAEVRGRDTIIPGTAGRTVRSRVRDRRIIELAGFIAGTGSTASAQLTDVRDALEELRTLFDPTRSSASLVVDLEDGTRTATITARPRNMLVGDDAFQVYREVSVELEAVGADWVVA